MSNEQLVVSGQWSVISKGFARGGAYKIKSAGLPKLCILHFALCITSDIVNCQLAIPASF